ncbi:hypothetical protein FMM68_01210 [Lachnospiraceae bacterium MD329]|nr:hypothetical protein [Lachnospiraceae bacterium MD329]
MKKLFSIICIITVLFLIGGCEKNESTNSIDLSSYSKDELVSLRDEIDDLLKESESIQTFKSKTDIESNEEFPFSVKESDLPKTWSFKPLVKQRINYPTWVITQESDVLDEPPYANLFIDGSSAEYYFTVNQVETKEIMVQDENRELQTAFVNTEVIFKAKDGYRGEEIPLNERPAYLLKDKKGQIYLALKNYDGEDWYVLYIYN